MTGTAGRLWHECHSGNQDCPAVFFPSSKEGHQSTHHPRRERPRYFGKKKNFLFQISSSQRFWESVAATVFVSTWLTGTEARMPQCEVTCWCGWMRWGASPSPGSRLLYSPGFLKASVLIC